MADTSLQRAEKIRFSVAIQKPNVQGLINSTLQDPARRQRFIASITSAVSVNPALQECDVATVISCALLGEALELSPSPQLGQYYLVPFEDKKRNCRVATFILGYKGYIQLAVRSGQYRYITVQPVKKGELVRYDPFNETVEFNLIEDELAREATETIGYYAMFEYMNGFRKVLYWSREKMERHANRYSPAFGAAPAKGRFPGRVSYADYLAGNYDKNDEWAYSSFWYKDFDGMAQKTMLRQLISKWGIMSIEMRRALEADDMPINPTSDLTPDYTIETPEPEQPTVDPAEDEAEGVDGELLLESLQ